MPPRNPTTRRAFTFVELVVTVAVMGAVLTSSFVLLRTANNAWTAFDADHGRLEMAHASMRHMVRKLRQATAITSITTAANTSGSITATLPDASSVTWTRTSNQINYNPGSGAALLASNITELTFTGYKADGTTATTTVAEIQAVKISLKVTLTRDTNATKTITCWAWRRSF